MTSIRELPDEYWNAGTIGTLASHGLAVRLRREDVAVVTARMESGLGLGRIYGGGLLLSERAVEELKGFCRDAGVAFKGRPPDPPSKPAERGM